MEARLATAPAHALAPVVAGQAAAAAHAARPGMILAKVSATAPAGDAAGNGCQVMVLIAHQPAPATAAPVPIMRLVAKLAAAFATATDPMMM